MASVTITVRFYISGVQVGNSLTGTNASDTVVRNVTISGDPGLTVAQMRSANLRMRTFVTETFGDTTVQLYEINPPVVTYEPAGLEVQVTGPSVFNPSGAQQVSFSLTANTIAGTPTTYSWAEGGHVLGTSSTLTTALPAGPHTITLTVTDGSGDTFVDTFVIVLGMVPASRVYRSRITMG